MIYDLIFSRADDCYIAVPRGDDNQIHGDLTRFDSGPPSAFYACTGIPKDAVAELLSHYKDKYGHPLNNAKKTK